MTHAALFSVTSLIGLTWPMLAQGRERLQSHTAVVVKREGQGGGIAGACPATGSCFIVHPTPGCIHAICCQLVCDQDPFCCNNQWDSLCVSEAGMLCVGIEECPADISPAPNGDGIIDVDDLLMVINRWGPCPG
jgi:hypothetical protein